MIYRELLIIMPEYNDGNQPLKLPYQTLGLTNCIWITV